jgi:hypothetical protein
VEQEVQIGVVANLTIFNFVINWRLIFDILVEGLMVGPPSRLGVLTFSAWWP